MSGFYHDGVHVFVRTPRGVVVHVADAVDKYWADAIVYSLNLENSDEGN